jgi:hypothetical protein
MNVCGSEVPVSKLRVQMLLSHSTSASTSACNDAGHRYGAATLHPALDHAAILPVTEGRGRLVRLTRQRPVRGHRVCGRPSAERPGSNLKSS